MTQYAMKQNDGKKLVHQSQSGVTDSSADLTPEEKAYKDAVTRALLVRACHLPNNTWMQDWKQYMVNNHPILGICFHHKYHPVRGLVRAFSLVGSILFGLAVTNIIYLAFVFTATDYGKSYVTVQSNVTVTGQPCVDSNVVPALSVTNGNIALWTVGAFLNACFDNLIWALAACTWYVKDRRLDRRAQSSVSIVSMSILCLQSLIHLFWMLSCFCGPVSWKDGA